MKERDPLVFAGSEVERTHSEWDEGSASGMKMGYPMRPASSPDNKEFPALQFGARFQFLEQCTDTEYKNQHDEDNGDRQIVFSKIGAANMKIVIWSGEALAYYCSHTDENNPACEANMDKMGSL